MSEHDLAKKLDDLAKEMRDQQQLRDLIEKRLADNTNQFQKEIREQLQDDMKRHREDVSNLYTRFERVVWVIIVVLGGVMAFWGWKTFDDLPARLDAQIARLSNDKKEALDSAAKAVIDHSKSLENQLNHFSDLERASETNLTTVSNLSQTIHSTATNRILTLVGQFEAFAGNSTASVSQQLGPLTNQLAKASLSASDAVTSNAARLISAMSAALEQDRQDRNNRSTREEHFLALDDTRRPAYLTFQARYKWLIDDYHNMSPDEKGRLVRLLQRRPPPPESLSQVDEIVQHIDTDPNGSTNASDLNLFRLILGIRLALPSTIHAISEDLNPARPEADLNKVFDKLDAYTNANSNLVARLSWKPFNSEFCALLKQGTNTDVAMRALSYLVRTPSLGFAEDMVIANFIDEHRKDEGFTNQITPVVPQLPADRAIFISLLKSIDTANPPALLTKYVGNYFLDNSLIDPELTKENLEYIEGMPADFKAVPGVSKHLTALERWIELRAKKYPSIILDTNQFTSLLTGGVVPVTNRFTNSAYGLTTVQFKDDTIFATISRTNDSQIAKCELPLQKDGISESKLSFSLANDPSATLGVAVSQEIDTQRVEFYLVSQPP